MQGTAFKYKLNVQEGGKVELSVPLPKGTRVAVFVVEESEDDFSEASPPTRRGFQRQKPNLAKHQ